MLFVALIIGVIYMAFVNNSNLNTSPIPGNTAGNQPDVQPPTNPAGATPPPATTTPPTATPPATDPGTVTETPLVQKPTLTFESQQGATYN
ncbi:hypothetical protein MXD63_40380, partial [Frankia sp. Cpl3]|nr:hypothetical protein [Frankia sp. Cpl3]